MPFADSPQNVIAAVALVAILFAALFFIVTTPSLARLCLQLTTLATVALAVAVFWVISSFLTSLASRPETSPRAATGSRGPPPMREMSRWGVSRPTMETPCPIPNLSISSSDPCRAMNRARKLAARTCECAVYIRQLQRVFGQPDPAILSSSGADFRTTSGGTTKSSLS